MGRSDAMADSSANELPAPQLGSRDGFGAFQGSFAKCQGRRHLSPRLPCRHRRILHSSFARLSTRRPAPGVPAADFRGLVERFGAQPIQRDLETFSRRRKRDLQPEVARRLVLQLKLAETVAEGAGHQAFPLHQPDRHVCRTRRRCVSVRELAYQGDQSGTRLMLQLQIEVVASSFVQRVPRETVLRSHASGQRRTETVVHEPRDHSREADPFRPVQREDRTRMPNRVIGRVVVGFATRRHGNVAQRAHELLAASTPGREMRVHARTRDRLTQTAHEIRPLPDTEMLHSFYPQHEGVTCLVLEGPRVH